MAFILTHRLSVHPDTIEAIRSACEPTENVAWVGAKRCARVQRLRVYTLRGVPAKRATLALPDCWDGASRVAVEVGRKTGRFDGAERPQVNLRHWYSPTPVIPEGTLTVEEDSTHTILAARWEGGSWIEFWPRLRSTLAGYDPLSIILWHWSRYYKVPLTHEDARQVAEVFACSLPQEMGLAEANRLASRMLYEAARNAGWHKLTMRDRKRYRLESSGQWVREEAVAAARAALLPEADPTGCGEYTLDAAHGRVMTAYGAVDLDE